MDKILSALGDKPWIHLAAPSLVFLVTLYAGGSGSPTTFALFVCVSFVSAYFGGFLAGLAATALSAFFLVLQHVAFPPEARAPHAGDLAFSTLFFLLVGGLACRLSAECLQGLRSASYFQSLLGSMHDAVLVANSSGRVAFLNKAAETLTGWEGTTGVGQSLDAVVRLQLEHSREPIKLLARVAGKHTLAPPPSGSLLLVASGGAERHVECWSEPVPGGGAHAGERLLVIRDVSERLKAEKEDQEKEEQFRALSGCAGSGLLLLDRTGNCVYSNPACQKTGGFSAEEALGGGWLRFVHPDDRGVADEWLQAADQGKAYTSEFRFLGAGGSTRCVQLHTAQARGRAGQFLGHVGSIEDVTYRKQLEQKLAEHKHAVESLQRMAHEKEQQTKGQLASLQAAADRLQQELTEARQKAEEFRREHAQKADELHREHARRQDDWGRAEQQLREEIAALTGRHESVRGQLAEGQRQTEDLRREHAQRQADWERAGGSLQAEVTRLSELHDGLGKQLAEAREKEKRAAEEVRRLQDAAKQRAEEERVNLRRHQADHEDALNRLRAGHAEALSRQRAEHELALSRQQAEHEEALGRHRTEHEEALGRHKILAFAHALLANLGESVCAVDADGAVTFLNPAAEKLLGWTEADLLSQPLDRILGSAEPGGAVLATAEGGLLHGLAPGQALVKEQVLFRRRDGQVFPAACTVSAVEGDGRTLAAVVLIRDVSDRLRREGQLQDQVRRLGETGRWADGIVGRLAERVRPEIAGMQITAEELKEAAPEGTWFLESARALGKRLQGLAVLFERLSIAARIARDDFVADRAAVEVSDLVSSAVELCAAALEARQQHLTVYLPLEPEWLWADAALLRQALMILVENGTAHMGPGGEIELRVEKRQENLVFRVQDQGVGIDPEALPKLQALCARARRFWQGDGDGLGIGLAVARSIVELHGGGMTVGSGGSKQGCEVALRLPAWRKQPAAQFAPEVHAPRLLAHDPAGPR